MPACGPPYPTSQSRWPELTELGDRHARHSAPPRRAASGPSVRSGSRQSPCGASRRSRRACRRARPGRPSWRLVAGHAGLDHGRHLGQRRAAHRAADAERAQLAGAQMRQRRRNRAERHLGVAADHVDQRRRRALERHVQDVDPGHQLEQLAAEMQERADARRRILQARRACALASAISSLTELRRQRRIDRHHVRRGDDDRHRREGLRRDRTAACRDAD